MSFPTYSSAIDQTIFTTQHPDGVGAVYVLGGVRYTSAALMTSPSLLTSGGEYSPLSQEEKWIFDELADDYDLSVAA